MGRYPFKRWEKRAAAGLFDLAGAWVTLPWKAARKPLEPGQIRKILVIRVDQIGDLVMTLPAIRALKAALPQASVDLMTSGAGTELFRAEPSLNKTLLFEPNWFSNEAKRGKAFGKAREVLSEIKCGGYDLAVDFRGDLRNSMMMVWAGIPHRIGYGTTGGGFLLTAEGKERDGQHQVLRNLDLLKTLGISAEPGDGALRVAGETRDTFWNSSGRSIKDLPRPWIVVHAESGRAEKKWPLENFKALVTKIREQDRGSVILIGTDHGDRSPKSAGDLSPDLDLRGATKLEELPVLFEEADIFIGNDSGPAHLAAAQGMQVISIFQGPNDPAVWRPWTERLFLLAQPDGTAVSVETVLDAVHAANTESRC